MRPIKLTMSAFGSYAGVETINFEDVGGVFLITGDTGAGKTTIFDAIMYALYDQTSGGRREGNMMRSQYASLQTETYVELEFEYKGKNYRILRNPEYERESKRRDKDGNPKKTIEKSRVTLFLPDGTEYMGKKQETNRKIVEIIGLDAAQFTQTVMIAQGEFLRLLHAKSDERKEIFSRIFDTRIFADIQKNLREKVKVLYGELADGEKSAAQELSHLIYPENANFENLMKEASGIEERLSIIGEMNQEIGRRERECGKEGQDTEKILEKVNNRITLAESNNRLFDLLGQAQKKIRKIEESRSVLREKEDRLKRAASAERVRIQERELKNASTVIVRLEKEIVDLDKWIEKKNAERVSGEQLLDNIRKAEEAQNGLNELSETMKCLEDIRSRMKTLSTMEREQQKSCEALREAERQYLLAGQEYQKMNDAFLAAQAGVLASALREGMPCPVCGSTHHPAPSAASKTAPSQQDVRDARSRRDEMEKKKDRLQEKFVQRQQEFRVFEEMLVRDGKQNVGEDFKLDEPALTEKIEEMLIFQRKEHDRCQKMVDTVKGKPSAAKAEEELRKLSESIHVRTGERKSLQEQLKEWTDRREEACRVFLQAWKDEGFESEESYRASEMTEEEQEVEKQWCMKYREEEILAKADVERYSAETQGRQRIETDSLEQEKKIFRQKKAELDERQKQLYRQGENNRTVQENLKRILGKNKDLRQRYAVLQNLSATANGTLSRSAKIDFEAYVQRQYFRQVIQCANRRLIRMTDNQFVLRCRSMEDLGSRGSAGLDLDVYSVVTGTVRDVKTLSGGESFMAALSMALGLADVIQNRAGGIQLKTMFVDEGFGSLDAYSREQAIGILSELAGGDRMIGIISHVEELKESIERKLLVTRTKKGSHVRWLLS